MSRYLFGRLPAARQSQDGCALGEQVRQDASKAAGVAGQEDEER